MELGRYNLQLHELADASLLEVWLFWLLHAHEYEPEELLRLFPQAAIQLATQTIVRIAEITEDKTMYDAREKAIRDQQWALNASFREGEIKGEIKGEINGQIKGEIKGQIKGEIKLIQTLQEILQESIVATSDLEGKSLEELQALTVDLRTRIAKRG